MGGTYHTFQPSQPTKERMIESPVVAGAGNMLDKRARPAEACLAHDSLGLEGSLVHLAFVS
jgi:hypothetical protein